MNVPAQPADSVARSGPLVSARGVEVRYARACPPAVAGVDLAIARDETLALLGESGIQLTAGTVRIDGVDTTELRGAAGRSFRRRAQMILQDATASLNPRMCVRALIADPLRVQRAAPRGARAGRVAALLAEVGLAARLAERYPSELSGGERQRVALARALALDPDFLVCDEPVSALDATARLALLDLLAGLQRTHRRTLLFITHDPAAAARIADRVAVMHAGRIVEIGPARSVLEHPTHPYTQSLLAAVPHFAAVAS
jgi:ABC-type glutathione transport system ATPase component